MSPRHLELVCDYISRRGTTIRIQYHPTREDSRTALKAMIPRRKLDNARSGAREPQLDSEIGS